jgi:hypothetical protein
MTFTFLIIFYVYVFLLIWVAYYGYFQHRESMGTLSKTNKPFLVFSTFIMAILWPIIVPLRILTWMLRRTEV